MFDNKSVTSLDLSFKRDWKSEEDKIDRAWYQNEGAQDDDDDGFLGKADSFISRRAARQHEKLKKKEEEEAAKAKAEAQAKKKPWENLPSERRIDGERFEEQMMVRAGVAKYREVDTDFSQEVVTNNSY